MPICSIMNEADTDPYSAAEIQRLLSKAFTLECVLA